MNDETLLEEIGENLLEEKNNPAESENTTRQKQLMEQLRKELEAAKKQREEMERRTQELEAERKKAVEARKQAEKRAEEQLKRAEAERREREKRKKEAERSLSKEELEKRRRKQKKNLTIFFAYVVVLVHLSFLLWISLDFSGAIKSVFFWMGIVISGFLAFGVAEADDDKPGIFILLGWGLFILYVLAKAVAYLAS
jgi:pilus assembly protein TadC